MTSETMDLLTRPERLEALRQLCILDTPADPAFDRLTSLATRILKTPISLVTLVDADRQFFKSQAGLPEPWASLRGTPISHSFCQHTLYSNQPLVIPNAYQHDLVADNPAIEDLGVVAYLGIPLITKGGEPIGSFCVIEHEPREWTQDEIGLLTDLAASVMTEIELRSELKLRKELAAQLAKQTRTAEQMRLVGDFVQQVSHDLRTPLAVFGTSLHLLRKQALNDTMNARLDKMEQSMQHISKILDDFATLWHTQRVQEVQQQWVNMADLIETLCEKYPSHRVQPLLEDRTLSTYIWRDWLTIAVNHLLDNALRYSTENTIVTIRLYQSGDSIAIAVQDQGIGIPQQDQQTIFEPLRKLESARIYTDGYGGIGLAIVKFIAERHNGHIELQSELHVGSQFTLVLPITHQPV